MTSGIQALDMRYYQYESGILTISYDKTL